MAYQATLRFFYLWVRFSRKGLDLAIQALLISDDPNYTFGLWAGRFQVYERISQELESQIGSTTWDHKNIPAWMRCAECLIHPARAEPAGMVLIEALTHHLQWSVLKIAGMPPTSRRLAVTQFPRTRPLLVLQNH